MNIFRFLGDMCHLLAILLLLYKIFTTKSCQGLSGKSQVLFALVFTTRYLDLFLVFISYYNTLMKITYILLTYITVYCIYDKYKSTYEHEEDTFYSSILVLCSFLLAVLINEQPSLLEILWTFSIYLESVAILPQLLMLSKGVKTGVITHHYLFLLAMYRALYIVNWIYRYYAEEWYDLIAIVAGCVQTVFYCDFIYLYVKSVIKNKVITLEV